MTGRGSCATGGCAGTAIAADMPNYLRPLELPLVTWPLQAPRHPRSFPPDAEQQHSKAAKSRFPHLPRIGKDCAVSVFKMQIT